MLELRVRPVLDEHVHAPGPATVGREHQPGLRPQHVRVRPVVEVLQQHALGTPRTAGGRPERRDPTPVDAVRRVLHVDPRPSRRLNDERVGIEASGGRLDRHEPGQVGGRRPVGLALAHQDAPVGLEQETVQALAEHRDRQTGEGRVDGTPTDWGTTVSRAIGRRRIQQR